MNLYQHRIQNEDNTGMLEILCQFFNLYGKRIETWQRSLILKQRRQQCNHGNRSRERTVFWVRW